MEKVAVNLEHGLFGDAKDRDAKPGSNLGLRAGFKGIKSVCNHVYVSLQRGNSVSFSDFIRLSSSEVYGKVEFKI